MICVYKIQHPDYDEEKVDIYEMTRFFIAMHKESSFFLDEVPFTKARAGICKLVFLFDSSFLIIVN